MPCAFASENKCTDEIASEASGKLTKRRCGEIAIHCLRGGKKLQPNHSNGSSQSRRVPGQRGLLVNPSAAPVSASGRKIQLPSAWARRPSKIRKAKPAA